MELAERISKRVLPDVMFVNRHSVSSSDVIRLVDDGCPIEMMLEKENEVCCSKSVSSIETVQEAVLRILRITPSHEWNLQCSMLRLVNSLVNELNKIPP